MTVQVACPFNLLKIVGPDVTPEQGVTRYAQDGTKCPACAMVAGAGALYRNDLVPVAGGAVFGNRIERIEGALDLRLVRLG